MLANLQKPSTIQDIDHKIQKLVQPHVLYPGVYTEDGRIYGGWAYIRRMGVYTEDGRIYGGWAYIRRMGVYTEDGRIYGGWAYIRRMGVISDGLLGAFTVFPFLSRRN